MENTPTKILGIILIITCFTMGKDNIVKGANCKHSCGNFLSLEIENVPENPIEKIPTNTLKKVSEDTVTGFIMKREKYWVINKRNFGTKPVDYGRKTLLPNKEEAIQWFINKKCKIGHLCAPNGNCWGDEAAKCKSETITQWINPRTFQYLGLQWTQLLNAACTMDWECSFIEKEFQIHYTSAGVKQIVVDDAKLTLISKEPNQLYNFKTFNLLIPKMPKEETTDIVLDCFKHKGDLLCEEKDGAYVLFKEETRCTSLGSTTFCLKDGEFDRIRDAGSATFASISDLNQVRDAFVVNQEKENFNTFVLNQKIRRLQEIILKTFRHLSNRSPNILNGILGGNFHSRVMENGIFEVCQCTEGETCEIKEFHLEKTKFCSQGNSSYKTLYPFHLNKTLDYSIDDEFKFQGKDIHIEEALDEKDDAMKDFKEHHDNSSNFFSSFGSFINIFSSLNTILLYISLGLSIINFIRR